MTLLNDFRINYAQCFVKTLSKLKKGKPLDLEKCVALPRIGVCGISTGRFGKNWFVLPKGKALFKVFNGKGFNMPRNLSLINELLCSQLAKQVDLPCADYELAKHGDYEGLVSYNLLHEGEDLEDFMRQDLYNTSRAIDAEMALGVQMDKQKILDDLFTAVIFELITLQTDVKTDMFVFARNNKSNSIRFAGIVDNEFAFNAQHFLRTLPNENVFGLFGNEHKINIESVIRDYDSCADFRSQIIEPYILISQNQTCDCRYSSRMQEICYYANKNPHAKEILTQVLSNLDTDKAFENMKGQDRVEVDESYKTYVKTIVEYGKKQFEKGLSQEQA